MHVYELLLVVIVLQSLSMQTDGSFLFFGDIFLDQMIHCWMTGYEGGTMQYAAQLLCLSDALILQKSKAHT